MGKIWTIFKSRFRKPQDTHPEVIRRRTFCKDCPHNSLNSPQRTLKSKVYKALSDFYTWITFADKTELGQCIHPDCGCDIFFKTNELEDEHCPEGFWSVYKPNSGQIKTKQFRKWAKQ